MRFRRVALAMDEISKRRKMARQQQQEINDRRREKLRPVVLALRDPKKAPGVVAEAKMYVKMWRDRGLCSRDYIDAWDDLLDHPQKAADMLEEQSPFAVQLRQNSPFVSVVRKYKLAHAA